MTKRPNHSRLPLYCFVVFVSVFTATPAEAHLNSTGMGPIYDGLMHFLMSPEDLAPVLALALLAGLYPAISESIRLASSPSRSGVVGKSPERFDGIRA